MHLSACIALAPVESKAIPANFSARPMAPSPHNGLWWKPEYFPKKLAGELYFLNPSPPSALLEAVRKRCPHWLAKTVPMANVCCEDEGRSPPELGKTWRPRSKQEVTVGKGGVEWEALGSENLRGLCRRDACNAGPVRRAVGKRKLFFFWRRPFSLDITFRLEANTERELLLCGCHFFNYTLLLPRDYLASC